MRCASSFSRMAPGFIREAASKQVLGLVAQRLPLSQRLWGKCVQWHSELMVQMTAWLAIAKKGLLVDQVDVQSKAAQRVGLHFPIALLLC